MPSDLLRILFVALLVMANGFFVAAEFALVKVRLGQIEQDARAGNFTARLAKSVIYHIDAYLSACQLGITLASLVLGWLGEAVFTNLITPVVLLFGFSKETAHVIAMPLAFVVLTFLHITIGEQAPKILAIRTARATALWVALPLWLFYNLFWPFIWVLNKSSNLILLLIGIKAADAHEQLHSEEELRLILAESAAGGEVSRRERLMMENVLDLEEKVARQVMVPRRDVVFLNSRKTAEENLVVIADSKYTRFPLCDGELDRVVGMIHTKDVLNAIANGDQAPSLVKLARKLPFLPETMRLDVLLREFQRNRTHVAMIVDEYGTVSGMVTFENVLEQLVGPIQDEFDRELPQIIRRGNGRVVVDGLCPLADLVEQCHVTLPEVTADTTGGMVIELLGHIPEVGEKLRLGRHEITVTEAEATRIRRVELVEVEPAPETESQEPGGLMQEEAGLRETPRVE